MTRFELGDLVSDSLDGVALGWVVGICDEPTYIIENVKTGKTVTIGQNSQLAQNMVRLVPEKKPAS